MKLSIISKYQIDEALRHQLALKPDNFFVQQFDLKRAVLEARLPVKEGKDFVVLNTHLSAFISSSPIRSQSAWDKAIRLIKSVRYQSKTEIIDQDLEEFKESDGLLASQIVKLHSKTSTWLDGR